MLAVFCKRFNMARTTLFPSLILLLLSTATSYRLPTIYEPMKYDIKLTLPEEIFTTENATSYSGTVAIMFTTLETVSEVVLHASDAYIKITSASLINNTDLNVTSYSVDSTTEILTVSLNNSLAANTSYVLKLDFDGRLSNTDMYGFYKSSYTDSSNKTYYLATTQMEATYARRAFPCFDEPQYKATFDITLSYPKGQHALGNMIGNTTTSNDTLTTVFHTTPKMSTYLIAFIISSFSCSDGIIEEKLPYKVCSSNETSSTRELALEVAPLVIHSLNSYLKINYSSQMEKLDQVAIPDFSSGAMENWGLVTYRERALLYDPKETSNAYRQYIASVIAHELAHQWFGNLVTCNWWSEIFLNEGFATFFEYFTTNEVYPDFQMDDQFVIKVLQEAFEEDTTNSKPLRSAATTPSEISARFDRITYDKGGSVLRMVEHILGTDVWKTGLNRYLNKRSLSTAEPEHLWTILGENVKGLPVDLTVLMKNWIDAVGFPVVNVHLNGTKLIFTQKPFVFSNNTNTTWYVPITYTTSENTSAFQTTIPMGWITPTNGLTMNVSSNISWIVVNNLQTGFYRVNYDSSLWTGLSNALQRPNFSDIPEINRAQIVNDAFNLARGGYITYSQVFNIIDFLADDTSYIVWYPAFRGFSYLLQRIGENTTLGSAISSHVLNLTSVLTDSVPMKITNSSDHIYTLKQVQAQTWACKLGNSNCTDEAVRLFKAYKNSSSRPDKNLRSIVYCYGLKHSTNINSDWAFLWNTFLGTSLSTEQVTILSALGCSSNKAILKEYLNKTLTDDSGIRSQDYASVFSAVYRGSAIGVDTALDFFINEYNAIVTRYTSLNSVGNILKQIAEQLTTDAQIIKLREFIASNELNGTLLEDAKAALSSAQKNQEWVRMYESSLNAYYGIGEETTTSTSITTTNSTTSVITTTTAGNSTTATTTTNTTITTTTAAPTIIPGTNITTTTANSSITTTPAAPTTIPGTNITTTTANSSITTTPAAPTTIPGTNITTTTANSSITTTPAAPTTIPGANTTATSNTNTTITIAPTAPPTIPGTNVTTTTSGNTTTTTPAASTTIPDTNTTTTASNVTTQQVTTTTGSSAQELYKSISLMIFGLFVIMF